MNRYDKEILALFTANTDYQSDFLNLIRGGDSWYSTGYRLKPHKLNWLKLLLGTEEYEETGYWYWKDDGKHVSWVDRHEDLWRWEVNSSYWDIPYN